MNDDDLNLERELNAETDNVWKEGTDTPSSDRRKKGFRMFMNVYRGSLLHYFPCFEHEGVLYFHVIEEKITLQAVPGDYHLMTEAQIKETYGDIPMNENQWK